MGLIYQVLYQGYLLRIRQQLLPASRLQHKPGVRRIFFGNFSYRYRSGIEFSMYKNTIASTSGGTLLSGETTNTYTPSAAVAGTLYYYCVVTGTCGSVTSAISGAFIVNQTPIPTINANYCSVPGKIQLTATGGGTYLWSTGATTNIILVDLAGIYSVTATVGSCSATAILGVANELVVNGNFSAGYSGFTSAYGYVAPAPNSLLPEGLYTVYNNPTYTHPQFFGRDHTTNSGNMMIVNGSGSPLLFGSKPTL